MNRLLLAIDQFDSGQVALVFAAELATVAGAEVTVLHVRERAVHPRVPSLESPTDAQALVDEAVFCLRQAGIVTEGRMRSLRADHVARCITYESKESRCDAIVLGSRRLRGIERASGRGVRERVIRSTELPVLVAPATPINKVHRPYALQSPSVDSR
jgi:nucleotide-binding universal stress UspA family protein